MANPFDQFDQVQTNPFDQFDNPFDQFDEPDPNSFQDFLKSSVIGNLPLGIAKGGDLALRGLDSTAAAAARLFGQQEEAERILRESDARAKSMEQFFSEHGGQGKAAQLGQSVGALPSMLNPLTAPAAATGGLTDLQRKLDDQGVSPDTAAKAAWGQLGPSMVQAALPMANVTRLAGAVSNIAAGGVGDLISQNIVGRENQKVADEFFDPLDPVARITDLIGGAATSPVPKKVTAPEIVKNLDSIDTANKQRELTQSQETLYAGQDGTITKDLPSKVTEDPQQTELAYQELQKRLQEEAIAKEQDVQGDLFRDPEQLEMDLQPKTEVPASPAQEPKSIFLPKGDTIAGEGLNNRKLDLTNLDSYNKATGEFDGTELIGILKNTLEGDKVNLPFKGIYEVLEKGIQRMQETGKAPRFAVDVDLSTGKARSYAEDRTNTVGKSPALYDPNTDTVWFGNLGQRESTVVHETAHALTSRMLHLLKASDPLVRGLYDIYYAVNRRLEFQEEYGITDIHEFIAEAFSNPEFQSKLAHVRIESSGRIVSGIKAIVREVMTALGFTQHDINNKAYTDAFEEILLQSKDLIDKYSSDKQGIDLEYQTKFPSSVPQIGEKINVLTDGKVQAIKAAQSHPKVFDAETPKENVIRKTTGVDFIPEDPKVTPELVDMISKEKDGSGVWALTPGAVARSELAKSTLVKTVYRFMNNAFKRAEKFNREVVVPVEKSVSKLLRSDKGSILHDVLTRELRNGRDYTREELQSAGVPGDVITSHLEFRAMMQDALDKQNLARADKGLPPVKAIDAYISARWSGPWRANIRDSEGKIVFQIAEQTRGMAKQAMDYIKARNPNLKYEDVKYKEGRERGDTLEAGYLDMLKILDESDPRVETLKSIYEDYILGKTENVSSQEQHFKRKTGVQGWAGNRPWAKDDVRAFFEQQFQYAKNAARWADTQKAMDGVAPLLNDPKLQESQKNNIQFSKELTKNQLGYGTSKVWDAIDNGVAKALGISPQTLQKYNGAGKTAFYLWNLGLSIPFTITQFLQPAVTGPALHAKLSAESFTHNPVVSTLHFFSGGLASIVWHYAKNTRGAIAAEKLADSLMTPLEKEAAQYLEDNGVIDINPMSDIKRNLRPAGVKAVAAPFEFFLRHPELISRSVAFMGIVSHLEQSGAYDTKTRQGRLALFQKAEEMTGFHMADYRPQERALQFERMGLTGDALVTLRTYMLNNLMQGLKYTKMAKEGNAFPLFYFVAAQAAAGGLTGLWFLDDLDDLLENLKKLLSDEEYKKVKDFSLKNLILDNTSDWAANGLVSKATGTNIQTRMNQSNMIPAFPFEEPAISKTLSSAFPSIGWGADFVGGALAAASPSSTPQERMQGLYQAAPAGAKGALEGLEPFSTRLGPDQILSRSPHDVSKGKYVRTDEEQDLRALGFRSPKEQKFQDKDFHLSKVERQLQDRIATNGKKAKEFVASGNMEKAMEHILRYDSLGGDPEALMNSLSMAQRDRLTTELQRRALAADSGSKPAVLKLQRYLDAHKESTPKPTPVDRPFQQPPPQRSMNPQVQEEPRMELTSLGYDYPKDVNLNVLASLEQKYGLPHGMLEAVMHQESRGKRTATSYKGAQGYFQFMPSTAKELGVNPRDFESSADGAARYLKSHLDRFGDPRLALAAYNAGPTNVAKHKGIPPFKETQDYVRKIMERMQQHAGN